MSWVQGTKGCSRNCLHYSGAETTALGSGFWGLVGLGIGKSGKALSAGELVFSWPKVRIFNGL